MINRRNAIKLVGAGTGAVVASGFIAAPAIAQGKRELKLVTAWPKNFPGLGTGAQRFADRVTAATAGRITVKLFASGELVPAFEAFDAVSTGSADMYHAAEYYWQGKSKAFNFFAGVPLGMTAPEFDAWIYYGGGQALWDELSAGFNLKTLLCGNTGPQMGGWFKKEINSVEDLKGLKIRMPGLGGEVMRRIGAAAVSMPGGEIFTSLQSGAIDATEFVGPWNDLALGFYKITKNYYYPGFQEPGTANGLGINKAVWESLTEDEQALFTKLIKRPNGIVLVSGPTGSGKTTTLYASLDQLNNDDVNIITVEDPVEIELEGVNQVNVNPEIDFTFANALRSILRQDPNIIMVGEIRDTETAQIAVKASLTGHLVLSTIHTNSAVKTITRLIDMGIDAFLVASSLSGVVAQRLIRVICPHCNKEVSLSNDEKSIFSSRLPYVPCQLPDVLMCVPNPF